MNTAPVQAVDSQFSQENDVEDNLKGLAKVKRDYIFHHPWEISAQLSQQWLWWLRVAIALSMFLKGLKWNVVGTEGELCSSHKNLLLVLLSILRWGLGETCAVIRSPGHDTWCIVSYTMVILWCCLAKFLCMAACNMIWFCWNNTDISVWVQIAEGFSLSLFLMLETGMWQEHKEFMQQQPNFSVGCPLL